MTRVALVGCGKSKRSGSHPARDLYTGPLFRAALAHAERTADQVFIVSAKYGLLPLDRVVESYDLALADFDNDERRCWGGRVVWGLLDVASPQAKVRLVVYAGAVYAGPIVAAAQRSTWVIWPVEQPLRGLGIGERRRWFREHASDGKLPDAA